MKFMSKNEEKYIEMEDLNKKRKHTSFGKTVFVPFVSGALGAVLVVGTCFGVPSIRTSILGTDTTTTSSKANTNTPAINTNFVSLSDYSNTSVGVAQKVLPSVVSIETVSNVTSFFGSVGTAKGAGSGIILSEDGYILTNNHVVSSSNSSTSSFYQISDASEINVYLYNDSTPYSATVVGQDELTDIAVLKIDKTGLTPAEIGNSSTVQVGEFAMVIGNSYGLQGSVTTGNISAVNREITDSDGRKRNLIQTTAAINSGNSGGALANSKGEIIGISTMKIAETSVEGICFAIPIDSVKDIYNELIQYGKVRRPYVGIAGVDIDQKTAERYKLPIGVYVKSIENFSPAEKAGLKVGDVITELDGKAVTNMDEFNEIKLSHKIGDTVKVKLVRDGNEMELNITFSENP